MGKKEKVYHIHISEIEGEVVMNSRERVLAALSHKEPDKVPISIGTTVVDAFTKFAKDDFERFLNLEVTPHILTHKVMGTVVTPDSISKMYETDFATIRLKAPRNYRQTVFEDGSYLDDYGALMKPTEYYYDTVSRPLEGDITIDDIRKAKAPDPYAPGRTDGLREEVENLREKTDCAIAVDIMCGGPFEQSLFLRGWEDFLCDLYTEPKRAEALLDFITEIDIGLWDVFLTAVGEYVDIVCQGDDLAMQDRALVPIDIYNKYIKKYHKRMYDFIRSKTKARIFHHSCGSIYELIPGLIDVGIDILNPVQTSAKNMEPERLKKEFGKDLTFWGAIDTQKVLPYGTLQEIDNEVKRVIEVLGKDGGYVFAPCHNIQPLVPGENIETMLKAALKYRNY